MFCKVAIGVAAARIAARRSVIDDLPSHGDAVLLGMARDYAILQLLATYGLRSGEISGLRLQDIDWRTDILHIRRSVLFARHSIRPYSDGNSPIYFRGSPGPLFI